MIRVAIGFFLVFGALGGMDNDAPLLATVGLAALGVLLMGLGVDALNRSAK